MTTLPEPVATPLTIDPALLDPNPYQPQSRLVFTPAQLADLASIKDIGFLQKPQVRMHSTTRGRYQIVFGHRRIAACQGCAFNRTIMHTDFCLRPACWKAKLAQHAADVTAAISKAKHLPVAAPDERIRYIDDANMARAVLATKHAAIRLAPKGDQPADYWTRSQHKSNTGSEYARIAVLTSQADEVLKIVTAKTAAKGAAKTRNVAPTDWAKKQREQESKRKAYRAAVDATLTNLTPIVAAKLPNDRTSLELIATVILMTYNMTYNSSSTKESVKIADQWNKHKSFTAKPADLKNYIGREMIGLWVEEADSLNLAEARKTIAEYCVALKITLPPHWDAALTPPAEDAKPVAKPKRK